MNKIFSILLLSSLLVISCTNESEELKKKIIDLENQLDDCQNGESKLISKLKNSYALKEYQQVVEDFNSLSKRFPHSSFLAEGNGLASESEDILKNKKIEEEKQKEQELEIKKASLKKLNRKHDDVSGITWYKQKYFTHYTNTNRTSITLGHRKGSKPWINLMMSYTGDDWIFFKNAYLSYDGNTKEIYFDDYRDKETDNDSGVWEWIEVQLDDDDINWLKSFASSNNAKMRLSGKYTKTRNLTPQERQGILDVISGYELLKQNPNL